MSPIDPQAVLVALVDLVEPYVLTIGALLGVFIRARVRDQMPTWSLAAFLNNRECVTDGVIAGALAFVWTVPIEIVLPVIGSVSWPPFDFPEAAGLAQRAVLMGLGAFLFVEILKIGLLRWPMFERYAGTTIAIATAPTTKPTTQSDTG